MLDKTASMRKQHEDVAASPLNHTQHAFYVCSFLATLNIFYDSTHLFYERYHLNKKWFYLYGAMFAFGYLYTRPLIRRRFGSASERNINWSSIYAVWLCAAVFYHSPSFASLGLDIKADVSMLIAVFLGSLLILSIINALYGLAVLFRILSPRLLHQNSGPRDAFTTVILNSVNLAIACSLYYSLCGNAPSDDEFAIAGGTASHNSTHGDVVRNSVCEKWLHPLSAVQHPLFSAWVIYGEAVSNDITTTTAGRGGGGGSSSYWAVSDSATAAAALVNDDSSTEPAISPVFTTWLTIFAMLVVNSVADYVAGATMSSAYSAEERRNMASASRRAAYRRLYRRRRSADYTAADRLRFGNTSLDSFPSLGFLTRPNSKSAGLDAILKTVSSVGSLWSPTSLETIGLKAASALLFRDDFGVGLNPSPAIDGVYDITPVPSSVLADPKTAAGVGLPIPADAPAPSFLPMFPWYSGTSADLIKTFFDLMVSVKVFLGRFDQRTMQAVTATTTGGCGSAAASASGVPIGPHDGDGFTYEHLAEHEEAWIDFIADTGDGGDSTYSVARCIAAPQITVELPKEMLEASGAPDATTSTNQKSSYMTPPAHTTTTTTAAADTASDNPITRVLPRATCLVHGGDLAYPNPSDETYEQRLFKVYEDALPPPAHIHPGNLVINKPDLPPEYWEAADKACSCSHSKIMSSSGKENRGGVPCHTCRKAKVLNVYDGPSAFLIPGNHDHYDGLETFTRHIVHKGWLGGWLLPQEKSYFALRLPRGWWLFAMDLALVDDLDMSQYKYFARIAEERMAPNDSAIIVSHAPQWLINWFWGKTEGKNLRQLLRGPLRGRARMHLCGDLHFYMRHSFKPYTGTAAGAGGISPSPSEMSTPAGGSPLGGGSPTSTRCPTPIFTSTGGVVGQQQGMGGTSPQASGQLHQSLLHKLKALRAAGGAGVGGASPAAGSSPVVARSINKDILGSSPRSKKGNVDVNGGVSIKKGRNAATSPAGWSTEDEGAATAVASAVTSLGASPPDLNGSLHFHPVVPGSSSTTNRNTIDNCTNGTAVLTSRLPPLPPGAAAGGIPFNKRGGEDGGENDPIGPQAWWPNLQCKTPKAAAAAAAANGGSPLAAAIAAVPTSASLLKSTAATSTNLRRNAYSASGLSTIDGGGEWEAPPAGWILNDPEHLVVCGSGGAFLHPTHVFSYSRFRPPHDPAAGPLYLRPPRDKTFPDTQQYSQGQDGGGGGAGAGAGHQGNSLGGGGGLRRSLPSDSSLYSLPRSTKDGALSGNNGLDFSGLQRPTGGEYRCQAAFPTPEQSLRLGRSNLHTFRHVNSRFDIIGGVFYYLLVISVLPRCTGVGGILEAQSVVEGLNLFFGAGLSTIAEIFESSYISLAAFAFLFIVVFGFAGSGGVGAISGIPPAARRRPEYKGFALAVRARLGGLPTRLAYATAHAAAHLSAAITLLILLELGIEMVMKYEGVGQDGYHSLYKWYRSFETLHFPDPAGLRSTLSTLTLGIYPNVFKWAFAIFDIPEAIAVSRTAMCTAGGTIAALTRLQTLGYYGGVLLYFWVLATPTVGLIFGLYLYVSGNWLHVHYDESFSALQVPHHKGFLRLHITKTGDLEVFALGLEESPSNWREDPRWKSPGGGGIAGVAGHRARWPSRWVPVFESAGLLLGGRLRKGSLKTATPPEAQLKVVDYFYVPKRPTSTQIHS
ncbi:hypothetical protein NADE_006274 [Nannochloris sp. 'desiccata']|nr:hypothetical protein NADE_006274 [Chlorella desiccata (nom. nud.)]